VGIFVYSSPEFARNVTMAEFVRYVLWEGKHRAVVDHHWQPQYDICKPCHINYSYIGYFRTIQDDAKDVLRDIAAAPSIEFPSEDYDNRGSNSTKHLELFLSVSVSDLRRLLDFYRNDYKVFGFRVPDIIRRRLGEE